jgi:hypothetical protein
MLSLKHLSTCEMNISFYGNDILNPKIPTTFSTISLPLLHDNDNTLCEEDYDCVYVILSSANRDIYLTSPDAIGCGLTRVAKVTGSVCTAC